jgi:hypothetical protein
VIINSLASPLIVGWGIDRYTDVANALAERGIDVLMNGGTGFQLDEFTGVAHRLRERVFLVETPSPRLLAAVIERCDLLIGQATGQSWLATALGKPMVVLLGPGDQNYPALGRGGPPWWPWPPRVRFISKFDWCQATTGTRCPCRYPPEGWGVFRAVMKRVDLWKPWKRALKSLGLRRRRGGPRLRPPCLDALKVEDVVDAALQQLEMGRWARPAAEQYRHFRGETWLEERRRASGALGQLGGDAEPVGIAPPRPPLQHPQKPEDRGP